MRMTTPALVCLALAVLAGCTRSGKEKESRQPASPAAKSAGGSAAADSAVPGLNLGASQSPTPGKQAAGTPAPVKRDAEPAAGKLEITDLEVGTGAVAESGKSVTVHYRGTLTNGKEFDASRRHGRPFTFELGAREVIRGWDEGVKGMKVGGKRKLVIPPDQGYGADGMGDDIPPNATLVFEVELLEVK